jgi:hypothetical protein
MSPASAVPLATSSFCATGRLVGRDELLVRGWQAEVRGTAARRQAPRPAAVPQRGSARPAPPRPARPPRPGSIRHHRPARSPRAPARSRYRKDGARTGRARRSPRGARAGPGSGTGRTAPRWQSTRPAARCRPRSRPDPLTTGQISPPGHGSPPRRPSTSPAMTATTKAGISTKALGSSAAGPLARRPWRTRMTSSNTSQAPTATLNATSAAPCRKISGTTTPPVHQASPHYCVATPTATGHTPQKNLGQRCRSCRRPFEAGNRSGRTARRANRRNPEAIRL